MGRFATLILLAACLPAAAQPPVPDTPRAATVHVARNNDAIQGFEAAPSAVARMVHALVTDMTGEDATADAWRALLPEQPGTVGIKVTTSASPMFATHFPLVAAVIEGLRAAGVPAERIIVWDKSSADLEAAGFTPEALGCRVIGIDGNYADDPAFFAPRPGKLIWGDRDFQPGAGPGSETTGGGLSSKSHFAAVLGQIDTLINAPVLTDSAFTGLAGAMASMTLDSMDNWRRFARPPDHGAPDIPRAWAEDPIGPKVALNLIDGLNAQFAGGPWFAPNYIRRHASIYASRDPVALDAIALEVIDTLRAEAKLPPASDKAGHIEAAAALGLGVADPEAIRVRTVTP